jgi:hypothetical protein
MSISNNMNTSGINQISLIDNLGNALENSLQRATNKIPEKREKKS